VVCVVWNVENIASGVTYLQWLDHTFLVRFIFIWLMIVLAGINGWLFSFIKEHQQNELREKENENLMRQPSSQGCVSNFNLILFLIA